MKISSDLVLVSRDALAELVEQAYGNERCYAAQLEAGDPALTIAVQAGLPLPGPMAPGQVPPAPPELTVARLCDVMERLLEALPDEIPEDAELAAPVYRDPGDPRLRCSADGKVVYTTQEQAESAAGLISKREPMKAYFGSCGHYHVSRRKR